MNGLTSLVTVEDVARQRGIDPAEIDYRSRQRQESVDA